MTSQSFEAAFATDKTDNLVLLKCLFEGKSGFGLFRSFYGLATLQVFQCGMDLADFAISSSEVIGVLLACDATSSAAISSKVAIISSFICS